MSQRANLIKCEGLVTHGSELSVKEGSLRQATNVNIDEDGVITPRRGFADYGNPTTELQESKKVKQLFEYKQRLFRHFENQLQFEDENGNFNDIVGNFTELRIGYRIKSKESKGNTYFTTDEGIKKISILDNSFLYSGADVVIDQAGIPKAAYMEGESEDSIDGFLDPQSKVAYRFIFGRKDNNNNLLLGSPSSRHVVTNGKDRKVHNEKYSFSIAQDFDLGNDDSYYITDGDYIVINSLNSKVTFYFKTTSKSLSIPQNAETIGSTFIEVDVSSTRNQVTYPEYDKSLEYQIGNKVTKDNINYNCIQATDPNPTDENQIPGFGTTFWEVLETPAADLVSNGSVQNNIDIAGILSNIMSNNLPQHEVSTTGGSSIELTSKEEGDIPDPFVKNERQTEDSQNPGTFLTSITYQKVPGLEGELDGEVVEGEQANSRLQLIIPNTITTDYFIQLYRTAPITKPQEITGIELSDLDPGDESNLVYEANLTQTDIDNGFIEVYDDYPESFRASSTPLYTNEITGEGVLQANDPPPIALDIELFRSSMFYANTKTNHRLELTILSVDDFNDAFNDTTRIIIGNSTNTRYYTATLDENLEGVQPEGGNFLLSDSASIAQSIDETARSIVKVINQDTDSLVNVYYLSGSEDIPGKLLFEARLLKDDPFYVSVEHPNKTFIGGEFNPELPVSNQITKIVGATSKTILTLNNHGFSTGDQKFISFLNESTVYSDTDTYYEGNIVSYNDSYYECTDDNMGSGISGIDPTNISNWTQINWLPDSFSGVYTITKESDDEFSIEIQMDNSIDSSGINPFLVDNTAVFSPDVLSDNLEVPNRLYYSKTNEPEAVPSINYIDVGAKDEEITRILALRDNLFVFKGDGIYIVSGSSAPDFSVRLLDNTRLLAPDSAVVLNNQIYALTEQGVTVVTDSGAGIISKSIENLIDNIINAKYDYIPNTFGVAYENDRAYILFAPSEEDDISSTQAYRYNIFERTWSKWEYNATCGHVMERDNKLYLGNGNINYVSQERKDFIRTDHSDRNFEAFIASRGVDETEIDVSTTEGIEVNDVITQEQDVTINYVNRRLLRKMDIFDTGLELSGSINPLNSNPLRLTTSYPHLLEDQSEWYFKIIYTNNSEEIMEVNKYTVTKIDDNNFEINYDNTDSSLQYLDVLDFYSRTFFVNQGDSMPERLQKLHDHLSAIDPYQGIIDGIETGIETRSYTLLNMKENVTYLVDRLNSPGTISFLKDYKYPETITFEAYVTEVNARDNFIYSHTSRPFLQQPITVYKHIQKTIEWNPQHFGDPSALKQVRSVSIIFDQNNFYTGTAKFSSDVSQALTSVPVTGKGIGYFGDLDYNDLNAYWGGNGNDVPFRTVTPRDKQRCRYLSLQFEHKNAREYFRILGVTGVVRAISDRGYK